MSGQVNDHVPRRHLEDPDGYALCGNDKPGEFVVENPCHVTCSTCYACLEILNMKRIEKLN